MGTAGATVSNVFTVFQLIPPAIVPKQEGKKIYFNHDQNKLNSYWMQPDHLGSSSYITNEAGIATQHMEYLPFGETLVDEHTNSFNSPFKYNGKELDEETGNYYYGARYYDPKWSIFISVDPLVEKTMDAYGYCYQNPVKFIDPDGNAPIWKPDRNGNLIAEKGDNTATLAKYLNRSIEDVGSNFKINGKSIGNNYNFREGQMAKPNNNMTRAISRSTGISAYDIVMEHMQGERDLKNDNYMCQEACITANQGKEIGSVSQKELANMMNDFQETDSFDDLSFGEGLVVVKMEGGEQHYMVPYGKSQDGTPHVFSKEGVRVKPGVYELGSDGDVTNKNSAINIQRAMLNKEVESIKYYKYVPKND